MKINTQAQHELTKTTLQTPDSIRSFGLLVLRCCIHIPEAFMTAASSIGYDVSSRKFDRDDFLDPVQSLVFGGMQEFRMAWFEGNPWPKNGLEWIRALRPHFDLFFSNRPEFPAIYRQRANELLLSLRPPQPGELDLFGDGLTDYVLGVRLHRLEGLTSRYDPAAKRKALQDTIASIRIPGSRVEVLTSDDILDVIFSPAQPASPFYTGVRSFDYHYGRTALKGDAWLVMGHPGGGKTNFGTQVMGNTAEKGELVMYVTTEVKATILSMRACSAVTSISYGVLRTLMGSGGSHPNALEFTRWMREGPGRNFKIFDYRDYAGADYKEKLARMLEAFHRHYGQSPSLIIWDWLGKALDQGFESPWHKREAFSGVANELVDLASDLQLKTLLMAQADKAQKNKANYSSSDTQDAKNLADPMTGALGITSLMQTSDVDAGDREVHKEQQYFCVCKCREEAELRLAVRRDFAYARFVTIN